MKGMAAHSGVLAWRIPWTEEPGGLPPMGSQRDRTERLTHWTPSHQASSVPACVPGGSRQPYRRSSEDLGP